jgi:hypothetical protein
MKRKAVHVLTSWTAKLYINSKNKLTLYSIEILQDFSVPIISLKFEKGDLQLIVRKDVQAFCHCHAWYFYKSLLPSSFTPGNS